MTRTLLRAALLGLLGLLVLWAFVSYLGPGFSGDRAAALLRCN